MTELARLYAPRRVLDEANRLIGGWRLRRSFVAILFALAAILPAAGPVAAAAGCSVTDLRSGTTSSSLEAAILPARSGDTLRVLGHCDGTSIVDRNLTIMGVTNVKSGVPVLDGQGLGTTLTISAKVTATVTGLTITGGSGTPFFDNPCDLRGGGILNRGSLRLVDDQIVRNHIGGSCPTAIIGEGGGIENDHGTLVVTGSLIAWNSVSYKGGGIESFGGSVAVSSSAIVANNGGGGAGGIGAGCARLALTNSVVAGNVATDQGGGLEINDLTILTNSIVDGNSAQLGGGIVQEVGCIDSPKLSLVGATRVGGNTATLGIAGTSGGGIKAFVGTVVGITPFTFLPTNTPDQCVGC